MKKYLYLIGGLFMIGLAAAVLEVDLANFGGNTTFFISNIFQTNGSSINGTDINVTGIMLNGTLIDDWSDINSSSGSGVADSLWEANGTYIKPKDTKKVRVENEILVDGDYKVEWTGGAYIKRDGGNVIFQLG